MTSSASVAYTPLLPTSPDESYSPPETAPSRHTHKQQRSLSQTYVTNKRKPIQFCIIIAFALVTFAFVSLWHIWQDPTLQVISEGTARNEADEYFVLSPGDRPIDSPNALNPCFDEQGEPIIDEAMYTNLNAPTYEIYPNNQRVNLVYRNPASICIWVAVPQVRPNMTRTHAGRLKNLTELIPLGVPPDQIDLTLYSTSATLFQVDLIPRQFNIFTFTHSEQGDSLAPQLYWAHIKLTEPGSYKVHVTLDFEQFKWNSPVVTERIYHPVPIQPRFPSHTQFAVKAETLPLRDQPALPICKGGDHPGRWVKADRFAAWRPEEAEWVHRTPQNEFGEIWVPWECRYEVFDVATRDRCLRDRFHSVHWFGDSNSRRALRLMNEATTFCNNHLSPPYKNELCTCDDAHGSPRAPDWTRELITEVPLVAEVPSNVNASTYNHTTPVREKPQEPTAYFYFIGGLDTHFRTDWRKMFSPELNPLEIRPEPDMIVINFGNWGASFHGDIAEWSHLLEAFLLTLKTKYAGRGPGQHSLPPIVFRNAQAYCCSTAQHSRWYTTQRSKAFNKVAREVVRNTLGDFTEAGGQPDNVYYWDVGILGADERAVEIWGPCGPNHARPANMAVENQIFFNLICNV